MSNIVFISYAKEDSKKANEIYRKLRNEGFNPWMDDHNLLPGYNWDKEIKSAIRNARIFLLLVSTKTINKRGYIQKEIKVALEYAETFPDGEIFIVPAKIEECEMPEMLNKWQYVEIYKYGGFNKLIKSIEQKIERDYDSYKTKVKLESDIRTQMIKERILSRNTLIVFKKKNGYAISDGVYVEIFNNKPNFIQELQEHVGTFREGTESALMNIWPKNDNYRSKDNHLVHLEYDTRSYERIFLYNDDKTKKSAMNMKYFNIVQTKTNEAKLYLQDDIEGKPQALVAEYRNKIFALIMPMVLD